MTDYDFSAFLQANCNYKITTCKSQHWNSDGFSYRSKMRPDFGFLLLVKGHIRFDSDEDSLIANAGDLIFLPKAIYYEACIPPEFGDTEDYLINFDTDTSLFSNFPQQPLKLLHTECHELPEHFDRIIKNAHSLYHTDFYITGQFYILLDKILRELRVHSNKQKSLLQQTQELLTERPELSVREVAELCSISESGLRNQFKKAFGLSPNQYRMNAKITKAKYLLEATDLSVYAISEQLGFYDEAYFCKMFRKQTGCSPRKYASTKTI